MADYDLLDDADEAAADRRDLDLWRSQSDWHRDANIWHLTWDQRRAYTARMTAYFARLQPVRDQVEQRRVARCWWGFIALAILGAAVVAGVVGS